MIAADSSTEDHIFVLGVSHKTMAIELREKFFLSVLEKDLLLSELRNNPAVLGAFVLSTCNRTEVYAHLLMDDPQIILDTLFSVKKMVFTSDLHKNFYCYKSAQAVRHIFHVSAGLDSLVLGEKQILGQVKEATERARTFAMMTRELNILANLAIRTGKKAQTETEVGFGGSSISWAAVGTMQNRLGTLVGKSILVVGAGKMGRMAAEQLRNKNVGKIYVMNRSCDKAVDIASQIEGVPVDFWQLKEILQEVDACICSAGAPHYLIEADLIKQVMASRLGRPIVLIDISMPRNVEPAVVDIPSVELLTIDQLDQIVENNVRRRQEAVTMVKNIIERKENEYFNRINKARVVQLQAD